MLRTGHMLIPMDGRVDRNPGFVSVQERHRRPQQAKGRNARGFQGTQRGETIPSPRLGFACVDFETSAL
eukprot:11275487-Karenia_brevis.AAC.1